MVSAPVQAPQRTVPPGHAAAVRPAGGGRQPAGPGRAWALLADVGLVAALLVLTWRIGVKTTDFVGFPKGSDALDHAATVRLFMENFPHLLWNPAWFAGLPSVPGLYPPGYSAMIGAVVTASGTSIQHAMVVCCAAAYLLMAASLYGFVRVIAKSRTGAALAGLLVLTAPAFWQPSLSAGEYPRLTAMAFGYLATFIAALYTVKPSRSRFTAAAVATGVALAIHPVTGGLGALQVVGVLLFVPYRPRRDRLRTAGAAAAAMGGLAAWLYVPSLIGVHAYYILPQSRFTSSLEVTGTEASAFGFLLRPEHHTLRAFSPILFPLALLLTGIAAVIAWRLRRGADGCFVRALGSSAAMMIVVACVLGYAFLPSFTHANVELVGIYPSDMFSYAAWPLAAVSGVLIAGLLSLVPRPERGGWSVFAFGVAFTGATACLLAMVPVMETDGYNYEQAAYATAPLLPDSNGTGQYRIGLTDLNETSWVNIFTRTGEIGGPFNQGALNLDYITWTQDELRAAPTLNEAEFLAQWNALRWIEAAPAQQGFYQRHPEAFRYVGPSGTYRNYEVRRPSLVLAATDAPPVLVVGPYDQYNLVLRSLAITDDGPSRVIPVEGSSYIDDYSLAQLEQFPVLFLYGFQAHNPARAAQLIDAYVRVGGGVIADVAGDAGGAQLAAQLAQHGAPLPVTSWTPVEISGAWGFGKSQSPLTRGIDLSRFSPAVYAATQPYLVDAARKLAPGSRVVLESGAKKLAADTQAVLGFGPRPLLATEAAGKGLVIESGINLPYHDAVFSNATESSFLARMIQTATARSWASGQPAQTAAVLGADSTRMQVGTADGVLFKETDTPDWHVTVNGRAATVYPAGPGYMYVRLPSGGPASATVDFRYQLSHTELTSIFLSVLTILLLLAFLCHVRLPARLRDRFDLESIGLRYGLLSPRIEVQETRERLAQLMADPSPSVRRAALEAFPLHRLGPYADLFVARLREESDPAVLDAMRNVVVMHQWEPVGSVELLKLRRWAARATAAKLAATRVARVPATAGTPARK